MARTVAEVMNRELFHLRPDERVGDAARWIRALQITAAPVVDAAGRPLGVLSLRDCDGDPGARADSRMGRPAITVPPAGTITGAAALMVDAGVHHLVVTDHAGVAIGMVSALDVLAALVGAPARHPSTFPHFDARTGLTWSDDTPLTMDRVEAAPDEPGILVLVAGGPGVTETPLWAEATPNLRTRLIDLLSLPQSHPYLARLLTRDHVRFRAAAVADPSRRAALRDATGLPGPRAD